MTTNESNTCDLILIDTTFEQISLNKIIEYYTSNNVNVITDKTQIIINQTKVSRFRVFTDKRNFYDVKKLKECNFGKFV